MKVTIRFCCKIQSQSIITNILLKNTISKLTTYKTTHETNIMNWRYEILIAVGFYRIMTISTTLQIRPKVVGFVESHRILPVVVVSTFGHYRKWIPGTMIRNIVGYRMENGMNRELTGEESNVFCCCWNRPGIPMLFQLVHSLKQIRPCKCILFCVEENMQRCL